MSKTKNTKGGPLEKVRCRSCLQIMHRVIGSDTILTDFGGGAVGRGIGCCCGSNIFDVLPPDYVQPVIEEWEIVPNLLQPKHEQLWIHV